MDDTYTIPLTRFEALYLSDAMSHQTQGPGEADRAYPDLLLKIMSAVVHHASNPAAPDYEASFVRTELWMLRECAKTTIRVGSEPVGLNLLGKVAKGLLSLSAQETVRQATMQVGESTGPDEPTKTQYEEKLNELKGATNA